MDRFSPYPKAIDATAEEYPLLRLQLAPLFSVAESRVAIPGAGPCTNGTFLSRAA